MSFLVFLRALEHYNGVLFLTTNRVSLMDGAFVSRIHLSLYYPPLDSFQIRQIFADNIVRLCQMEESEMNEEHKIKIDRRDIMSWVYDDLRPGDWNGREIRNAFQNAASMARHDALDPELVESRVERGVLNHIHFMKVFRATREFGRYMKEARGAME